jgi:pSer/pThr/pTyr-binding forkhead associated (FHA) protein
MTLGSIAVEEVLLLLKVGFLVLLYLFIWRVVRTASRDLRGAPQESIILAPQRVQEQKKRRKQAKAGPKPAGKLVVVTSPALRTGEELTVDSAPLVVGREAENEVPLVRDEFTSGRHARIEPRKDGVWIEDVGSTNGTFVNGVRLTAPRKLSSGDMIRVGQTDLRFER